MIYGKSSKDSTSHGFNIRCQEINSMATMISMIQIRPDRFLSMNESTGELELILDTVREKGWFNINDLNSFRPFGVAASEYINQNNLPMMKNLHYFGYKSHLGEIVYDLGWLKNGLRNFDINDIYSDASFDSLYNCSHLTFRKILKFLIDSCFLARGVGKKTVFSMYHESDVLLKHIQVRLLDYGIMSSRTIKNGDYIGQSWDTGHLTSYKKYLKVKNLGDLSKQKISLLSIDDSSLDKFVKLTTYANCEKSELRLLKSLRACLRAKNLYSRNVFWDTVVSINKAEEGAVYGIINPSGWHVVLNGILVSI
jgi:hypothetical protein